MLADQLLQRFMAMQARVSLQKIRRAMELDDEDWAKIATAMESIQQQWTNRLIIDDEGTLTVQRLRTKVRQYSRQYGKPAAIFIDYLQLMRGTGKQENRHLDDIAQTPHCHGYWKWHLEQAVFQVVLSKLGRN